MLGDFGSFVGGLGPDPGVQIFHDRSFGRRVWFSVVFQQLRSCFGELIGEGTVYTLCFEAGLNHSLHTERAGAHMNINRPVCFGWLLNNT